MYQQCHNESGVAKMGAHYGSEKQLLNNNNKNE